jgi:NADH-quinone oxidoreductase subunit M
LQTSYTDDETRAIDERYTYTSSKRFIILNLSIASVALPTFNFVGEFTVLYSLSLIMCWYAVLGGNNDYLGAYYMLKMYQHVMQEKLTKSFSDVSFKEGLALVSIACLILWNVSKPITDLITPSLENILISN